MTSISSSDQSTLQPLDWKKYLVGPDDPGFAEMKASFEKDARENAEFQRKMEQELPAQFARQMASKVHTIFRVDGKIVAAVREIGVVSHGPIPGLEVSSDRDVNAKSAEKGLYAEYGSALEIDYYPPGSGLTERELVAEMFQGGPRVPPPEAYAKPSDRSSTASAGGRTISPVDFSAQMLEILHEQWRR